MKISQLPQEVKEKALDYQKNSDRDKTTDNLDDAFDWEYTKEREDYWIDWYLSEFKENNL